MITQSFYSQTNTGFIFLIDSLEIPLKILTPKNTTIILIIRILGITPSPPPSAGLQCTFSGHFCCVNASINNPLTFFKAMKLLAIVAFIFVSKRSKYKVINPW